MQHLKFKAQFDPTEDAHQHALDLEKELGVNLMNKDANDPNEVHGYVNTDLEGNIEVFLYEEEDLPRLSDHEAKHDGVPLVAHKMKDHTLMAKAQTWVDKNDLIDHHDDHKSEETGLPTLMKVDTAHYGKAAEEITH